MKHSDLISLAHTLGYSSIIDDGICRGFSLMWIQAICLGEEQLEEFNKRMRVLETYVSTPQKLAEDVAQVRELVKNGKRVLSEQEHILLEIPAFFEGISVYLKPNMFEELCNKKRLNQSNEIDVSLLVQSQLLEEQGGLSKVFTNTDQYNQTELTDFLNKLSNKLHNSKGVGINLGANNHSVSIRVLDKNKFQLVNTNSLNTIDKIYTSEQLAKELNSSFFNKKPWFKWFSAPKPLVMTTSIFTANNYLSEDLASLYPTKKLTKLFSNKSSQNLMHLAAAYNDVNTLKRIDFDQVDINHSKVDYTVFGEVCLFNKTEAFDFLLTQPSLDVNKGYPSPLLTCLILENYHLAKKLIEHPSFDPSIYSLKNNGIEPLHYIILLFPVLSPELMDLAKILFNKGYDINAKDQNDHSLLTHACMFAHLPWVNFLIAHGANLFETTNEGMTNMHAAATTDSVELIELLLAKGLSSNQLNNLNYSPLHIACQYGHHKIVELLLSRSNECNIRSAEGTPLMLACSKGHHHLIPVLLPKTELTMDDLKSNSPLIREIGNCEPATQIEFHIKALNSYIKNRSNDKEYLNIFGWGFSKTQKIAAAEALMQKLEGKETDLRQHIKVLNNGRLSILYKMTVSAKKAGSPQVGSTSKMCSQMGVTPLSKSENHQPPLTSKKREIETANSLGVDMIDEPDLRSCSRKSSKINSF